ncbi:fimbrial protein [Otariodibacter oris]|uniref:Type 1 fimbria pilin n=1 Tax=Otariodibacter oris TaxID=1032623 RepID=A0A420XG32_9PAST|nr:fimbrial protein [Otariodibacter oris]QGM79937.1 hypothetical protein A6A10_00220 [Otariodibacter oris]RKR71758.1 type 1 fimbria pilin [Otariodibacter oris]
MKKLLIALAASAAFSGSVLAAGPTSYGDTSGNITLSGAIKAVTCSLVPGSQDQFKQFDEVTDLQLIANPEISKRTINIETRCNVDAIEHSVKLKPTSGSTDNNGYLLNTFEQDPAKGVGFALLNAEGKEINLNNEDELLSTKDSILDDGGVTHTFYAVYKILNKDELSSGNVRAVLPFEVVYK